MSGISLSFLSFYRLVVPLVLLAAAVLRVNGISLGYLVILLVWTALPVNSHRPLGGIVLMLVGLVWSSVGLIGQAAFQIVLATGYKQDLDPPCTSVQRIWQQIGFNLMNHFDYQDFLRYLLPDVGVILTCLVTMTLGMKARKLQRQSSEQAGDAEGAQANTRPTEQSIGFIPKAFSVHNVFYSLCLFFAAVILPSILTGVYFLLLLAVGTVWSTYRSFPIVMHWAKLLTVLFSGLHLFVVYIYQFYAFQDEFAPDNEWIKLLGLSDISNAIDCADHRPWEFKTGSDLNWRDYVNPAAIFLLYFVASYEIHLVDCIPEGSDTLLSGSRQKRYSSLEPVVASSSGDNDGLQQDEERASSKETEQSGWSKFQSVFASLYEVIVQNSWHLTVIVMIAWSIIFVSWMTFVLLVWACVIWMNFHSRTICQYSSPVLVLYSLALVIGQYVYSLDGIDELLPDEEQTGFTSKEAYLLPLQIVFLWIFWLTLRQFFQEQKDKKENHLQRKSAFEVVKQQMQPVPDSPEKDVLGRIMTWTFAFVNEYWVLLCYAAFLVVSLTVKVSVMRCVYMAFFLLLLGFYQLSRRLYNIIITPMWWLVAVYSVIFVWMLYLFQLDAVHDRLTDAAYGNSTINKTLLSDIGLERFNAGQLLVNMLAPTVTLIIVMLQLKYFHRKAGGGLGEVTRSKDATPAETSPEIPRTSSENVQEEVAAEASEDLTDDGAVEEEPKLTQRNLRWLFWNTLSRFIVQLSAFVLRFLELYLSAGLLLCIVIVAIQQNGAIEFIPILVLCLCIIMPRFQKLFYFLFMLWTSLTIIAKMLYQLNFIEPEDKIYHCNSHPDLPSVTGASLARWFGLEKAMSIGSYTEGYIVIVILIALVVSVQRHQRGKAQKSSGNELPEEHALFLRVTRVDADTKFTLAVKYLVNNFFEIFGRKLCFLTFAIVAAVRLDAYGFFYCFLLALLLVASSVCRRRLWPAVVIIVALCLCVQYALLIGMPPVLCHFREQDYPWLPPPANATGFLGWLYLPVFYPPSLVQLESFPNLQPQKKWLLVGDFVLLLLLGWQWQLYRRLEEKRKTTGYASAQEAESVYKPPNFTFPRVKGSWQKMFLDYMLILVFKYGFWFTVLMVFLTGVNRISIFCLGYIIFAFIFLWFGQEQLTFRRQRLRRWWNALLCYNVFVIIIKVALQLLACVFSSHVPCGLVQLFNIVCLDEDLYRNNLHLNVNICSSDYVDTTGLALDVATFGFILVQRYLFETEYFVHVQTEMSWYLKNLKTGAAMVKQATRYARKKQKKADDNRQREIHEHVEKLKKDHQMHQFLYAGTKPVEGILEPASDNLQTDSEIDPTLAAAIDRMSLESEAEAESAVPKETDVDQSSDLSTLQKIKLMILETIDELTLWLRSVSATYRAVTVTLENMRKQGETPRDGQERTELQELDEHVDEPIFKSESDAPELLIDKFLTSDEDPDDKSRADALRKQLEEGLANFTSHFRKLFRAVYHAVVARTDLLCYFVMIINFIVTGSALSLPLPLFVFFWGLLSVPRPSKMLWIVVELYVIVVIVIRYVCQSTLIPLTNSEGEDLKWAVYVGIQQVNDFKSRSMADFVVLWAVSVHIAKLQLRGLWLSTGEQTTIDGHREVSPIRDEIETDEHEIEEEKHPETDRNFCKRLFHPLWQFFRLAVLRKYSAGWGDYYTLMVFFDVICFIITIFGWSSFGQASSDNVASYIEQNYIPIPFIAMLIVQFLLILVDRILYRSGWEFGKLVLHFVVVILVHIWVFLVLPLVTKRSFTGNTVVQTWYFFKCLYMGLSAAQISAGFPPRRSGNFLMDTKRYPTVKGRILQVLFLVPFLTELRELMDWCVANTTLEIILWLKVQDIWYEMFLVKCKRVRESRSPRVLGDRQPPITKFILGTVLILVLVFILWFPLLWISLLNSSAVPNTPVEVSVELQLGGYQPLFSFTAQEQNIYSLTSSQYEELKSNYATSNQKAVFVRYGRNDISRTVIPSISASEWIISPPARHLLAESLVDKDVAIVNLDFRWSITRNPPTGLVSQVVNGKNNIPLNYTNEVRLGIANMLVNSSKSNVSLPNLFPVFISGPANGQSRQLNAFHHVDNAFANCTLSLNMSHTSEENLTVVEWWNLMQTSGHVIPEHRDSLEFIIFNEPVTPPAFSFLAGNSVIGLYISIVLVIGQFLKGYTKGISHKIIYEDVPEPVDIIRICEDIFLVRDLGEEGLQLEELLVGKLFFLYRNPERMIAWTRIRQRRN